MKKQKIVIVVGATASGKSGLATKLAKRFSGEVISADSRQVYRELDIGTAKTTPEEMDGVPHHLIDVVDVDNMYTAADFKRDSSYIINDIQKRGGLPIIAGGTFFYIDALLGKAGVAAVAPNPELRAHLEDMSPEMLYAELEERDPERAFTIDRHNKRRLIRALEIVHELGSVPEPQARPCPYEVLTIGVEIDKETLRSRYESRAREWLARGFRDEVEGLLADGVSRDRLHEIGFEYQLILALIDGELDEDTFVQRFIEKNWQYAKRQLTWLRRDKTVEWYAGENTEGIFSRVKSFLNT